MSARSDKLHSKRKAKTTKNLKRRAASLVPNKRMLLVCEGEVTEVEYFKHLKYSLKLANIDIDICGKECGSAPTSVVKYAKSRAMSEGPHTDGGYNDVFCIFDRDAHVDFEKAKSQILELNKPNSKFYAETMYAVWSNPCFEIWLLFHFQYTRSPFVAMRRKSSGDCVTQELKKCASFKKFSKHITRENFNELSDRWDDAFVNAKKAYADYKKIGEPNPSTKAHFLVEYLKNPSKGYHG